MIAGHFYCSGSCYTISCAVLAALQAGPAPKVALSTSAKAMTGPQTSLSLPYGIPVGFNLLPCASSGVLLPAVRQCDIDCCQM